MMDHRTAVFPGSFDPITIGHTDIIHRALTLFDKVYVAIGHNTNKQSLFTLEQRLAWLKTVFAGEERVVVAHYEGLTVDFCRQHRIGCIVRGLRSGIDFEYERTIAQLNHDLGQGIESVFLAARPEYSHISSTIVREILRHKGDARRFLPEVLRSLKFEV